MGYIQPEKILEAKQMDLLTYLKNYDPDELVHICGNAYTTKSHDSLKISNGKWNWFSRGIGGKTALDYLIKVKGLSFIEAVERITGQAEYKPPVFYSNDKSKEKNKTLLLPKRYINNDKVINYLKRRGIDNGIIDYCISTNRLYESDQYHSAVFVGLDRYNMPRHATIRGIDTGFKGEATGSDKRFAFSIPAKNNTTIHVFESAIDLLSYATMQKLNGKVWKTEHLVSLAGVYKPKRETEENMLPLALGQFLMDHPEVKNINLRLDNDFAGRRAMNAIYKLLTNKYNVCCLFPLSGKDYNDTLCDRVGLSRAISYKKEKQNISCITY
ncbi:MAG: toprim domain-containing protein [Clostridia bacterium]|nr:toprim domain-containing protein [Clostridia bacterium]